MEYLDTVIEMASSAETGYLIGFGLLFLAGVIVKYTKTKTDDKYYQMLIDGLKKVKGLFSKTK